MTYPSKTVKISVWVDHGTIIWRLNFVFCFTRTKEGLAEWTAVYINGVMLTVAQSVMCKYFSEWTTVSIKRVMHTVAQSLRCKSLSELTTVSINGVIHIVAQSVRCKSLRMDNNLYKKGYAYSSAICQVQIL